VRNAEEIAEGVLEGAVTIPLDALQGRLNELPKELSFKLAPMGPGPLPDYSCG